VQLVGVASLLIATKYEEIYPPTVKDFIYLTDSTYERQEILQTEKNILFNLQFEIQQTSPYRFLERYSKIAKADSVCFYLAQYLLELALLDSKMNQYKPSLLASTAIYVALRVQLQDSRNKHRSSQQSVWTSDLIENTGYQNSDLQSCAKNYF
jgi:transcription initiation factor TFIIIB Brf1 subunit/transcription initiation factor TFIIB